MSYLTQYNTLNWSHIQEAIHSKTEKDVISALNSSKPTLEDFKALLAPAAAPFLEVMAQKSQKLTQQRFGKTIQLYAPLYLSNECHNTCTYCGFSFENKIVRKTLSDAEIVREAEVLKQQGYDHVLIVTGESSQKVGVNYIRNAIKLLRTYFSHIAIEVQPLESEAYKTLIDEGLNTVLVYQETYNKQNYNTYHLKGRKSNFDYRLDTPDRLGSAGIHKIGIGVLLGLEDWRTDSFFVASHLDYLQRTYWKTTYSISFPRIRPADGVTASNLDLKDKDLVQLICAYRIFNPEVELSLSTREHSKFRDNVMKLGITSMSAGSKTNPGGYAVESESLEQFEISDERTTDQVVAMIKQQGYEPVYKNWDPSLVELKP